MLCNKLFGFEKYVRNYTSIKTKDISGSFVTIFFTYSKTLTNDECYNVWKIDKKKSDRAIIDNFFFRPRNASPLKNSWAMRMLFTH